MSRPLQLVTLLTLIGVIIALVDVVMGPTRSPVRSTIKTVRDTAVKEYRQLTGTSAPPAPTTSSEPAPVPTRTRRTATSAEPLPTGTAPAASTPARGTAPAAPPTASPRPAPVGAAEPKLERGEFFLPGRSATWMSPGVTARAPMVIRAGGRVLADGEA